MHLIKFQSKTSEQLRKERRAIIDAQSVFTKLKTKKVSQKTKKALARQSLHNIVSQSPKSFSNFKNSHVGHTLGIVHKKSATERESERSEKRSESPSASGRETKRSEKESESPSTSERELQRSERESGVSISINGSQEGTCNAESIEGNQGASSGVSRSRGDVGKPQCLVSYEMSTSDSDDAGP